jgi:hypothetical protein
MSRFSGRALTHSGAVINFSQGLILYSIAILCVSQVIPYPPRISVESVGIPNSILKRIHVIGGNMLFGRKRIVTCAVIFVLITATFALYLRAVGGGWTLLAWNNLGMHCMDSDYSIFSILPPYNVVNAQLIDPNGNLLRNSTGITVTYEAVVDPDGSINSTSANKTNFWNYVASLFGASLPIDAGLAGSLMPGSQNQPQPMTFNSTYAMFTADGIPITPYNDAGAKNYYPLMHVVARDAAGNILAATDIVTPVSDEMDCRACHASDSSGNARPATGWVYHPNAERDYRLNILRKHDEHLNMSDSYRTQLTTAGYLSEGLYATASGGTPILCARCHASNALPGTGLPGTPQLTQSIHSMHASVTDPTTGKTLESNVDRTACYRCHPGSTTRCLRGAMGTAVASDGSLAIQCQSCHGSMSTVGASSRQGWLEEPTCQSCHTGTATSNRGQIRYTSAMEANGMPRTPANATFATTPGMPAAGLSLFRFSQGHGFLQCEACHNSTHAEFPSLERNDNIQSMNLQGHAGTISDCVTCHNTQPNTINGGPHGMHPVGQQWAGNHDNAVERGGAAQCQTCHGTDYRGTVLSRALGDRNLSTRFGVKQFWRGFQIGCYACHNGPGSDNANSNRAPAVVNASASTASGAPVNIALNGSDADGNQLQLRIVSQPAHGTVALSNRTATFIPNSGFAGADSFTFAAWDGSTQSNLGIVSLQVASEFFVPFYQGDTNNFTGFAVSNFGTTGANAQFTGYATDGRTLAFPANPVSFFIPPQAQFARLGSQIFGAPLDALQAGWVRISGDSPNLGCLYQFGDFGSTMLDGASADTSPSRILRFIRVYEGTGAFRGQTATTFLSIANPTAGPVAMTLNLLGAASNQALAPQQTFSLPANGVLYGSVAQIFNPTLPVSSAWIDVQVTSGDGVVGFELIHFPDVGSVVGLSGTGSGAVNTSYSAQLAVTPDYFTSLKLINTSTLARTITLHAVAENGTDLVPPTTVHLDIGQSLERGVDQLFGLTPTKVGSLRIDADGAGVIGDVLFGDPVNLKFAAASLLQSQKHTRAVFSHVANGLNYFTGLAVLNPNSQTASITLDVYASSGTKTGSAILTLGPGQRFSRLLTDLLPASSGQMGGYISLTSNVPIIAQELFGDGRLTFLSAVPPTIVN